MQILELSGEYDVLHAIFDSAVDINFPASILHNVSVVRGKLVGLGIQNIDLIALGEGCIRSFDGRARCVVVGRRGATAALFDQFGEGVAGAALVRVVVVRVVVAAHISK